MKKRSLRPAIDRMQQRLAAAYALPQAQQAAFYYCNGRDKSDFCSTLAAGNPPDLTLALDLLAAELHPQVQGSARYIHSIRTALRKASAAGLLSPVQQKIHHTIESRYLQRLILRAFHSEPGAHQQRALRRLPDQQTLMLQLFDHPPTHQLKHTDWPPVQPPYTLLQQAARSQLLPHKLAEQLARCNYQYLMELIHAPEDALPHQHMQQAPPAPANTLCYIFSESQNGTADWRIAPWKEIEPLIGFVLAADATFYRLNDDWGNCYGHTLPKSTRK